MKSTQRLLVRLVFSSLALVGASALGCFLVLYGFANLFVLPLVYPELNGWVFVGLALLVILVLCGYSIFWFMLSGLVSDSIRRLRENRQPVESRTLEEQLKARERP